MADGFFAASFGDLPLRISRLDTDHGRDIVAQSPARGSRHFLQDRGAKLGRVTAEIMFITEPGKATAIDRFREFQALVATGRPQILSHPLNGVFLARAEGGQHRADARSSNQITYDCTFWPEEEPSPVTPVGAGAAPVAGAPAVAATADVADRELAAVGLASSVPAESTAFVAAQESSADVDPQAIIVGVETLTSRIDAAIRDLELATTIERWPAYQSMLRLRFTVRAAGQALRSRFGDLLTFRVGSASSVISICRDLYGAELALERAEQVTRLNRVRAPNRVPAGTELKVPREGAR